MLRRYNASFALKERLRLSELHSTSSFGARFFLCFAILLLGLSEVGGATNFSRLIAWGQLASSTVSCPPGNSLPHIDRCYQLGYDGLELDVEISKDNIPIMAHDIYTNGEVADPSLFTFEELQQFNLGSWQGNLVRIPTLEAALRTNGNRGSMLILDMRVASSSAGAISNAVSHAEFDERLLAVSAYEISSGQVFKAALPQARVFYKMYLYPQNIPRSWVDAVAAAGLDGLMIQQPSKGVPIQDFVDYVHYKGLKLVFFVHYAFNNLPELQELVDARVDYILTVHHEMRDQVTWPDLPLDLPRLEGRFNAAEKKLTLSWQPQLPYGHKVQTSADGEHWVDLGVPIDATSAPARVECTVPADSVSGFFRLCFVP